MIIKNSWCLSSSFLRWHNRVLTKASLGRLGSRGEVGCWSSMSDKRVSKLHYEVCRVNSWCWGGGEEVGGVCLWGDWTLMVMMLPIMDSQSHRKESSPLGWMGLCNCCWDTGCPQRRQQRQRWGVQHTHLSERNTVECTQCSEVWQGWTWRSIRFLKFDFMDLFISEWPHLSAEGTRFLTSWTLVPADIDNQTLVNALLTEKWSLPNNFDFLADFGRQLINFIYQL